MITEGHCQFPIFPGDINIEMFLGSLKLSRNYKRHKLRLKFVRGSLKLLRGRFADSYAA